MLGGLGSIQGRVEFPRLASIGVVLILVGVAVDSSVSVCVCVCVCVCVRTCRRGRRKKNVK